MSAGTTRGPAAGTGREAAVRAGRVAATGHPADTGQREAVEQLRQAVHLFSAAERRLRGRNQRSGDTLSPGHLRALFVLMSEQEATAGRLAREADLNPASVTAMVDHLEDQGLVERRRDHADRRLCWISLTDAGRSQVAAKEALWRQRLAAAFADFGDDDLAAACRVLERLSEVFDASSAGAAGDDEEQPGGPAGKRAAAAG